MLDSHMFLRIDSAYLSQRGYRMNRIEMDEFGILAKELLRLLAHVRSVVAGIAEPTTPRECFPFKIANL
jgi:hypothetical protein